MALANYTVTDTDVSNFANAGVIVQIKNGMTDSYHNVTAGEIIKSTTGIRYSLMTGAHWGSNNASTGPIYIRYGINGDSSIYPGKSSNAQPAGKEWYYETISNSFDYIKGWYLFTDYQAPVVTPTKPPLEWVTHPTTGDTGTAISFSWKEGDPGANGYNVVVYDSSNAIVDDVNTTTATYSLNRPTAGKYTVKVFDKGGRLDTTASVITQDITLAVPVPALHWVQNPTAVNLGDSVTYKWAGGTPAAGGHWVVIKNPDGSYLFNQQVNALEKEILLTKPGDYFVGIYEADTSHPITLTTTVTRVGNALSFDVHPDTAVTGADVVYSVKDGTPAPGGFWINVVDPTGAMETSTQIAGNSYPVMFEKPGNYTVKFFDIDTTVPITQAVTVTQGAAVARIAWVDHPTNAIKGSTVKFKWSGGVRPAGGYWFTIDKPDGTTESHQSVDREYDYTFPDVEGTYTIKVYEKELTNLITQAVTVTAAPVKHPAYLFADRDIGFLTAAHCSMTVNGVPVTAPTQLYYDDELIVTADNGFTINESNNGVRCGFQAVNMAYLFTLNSAKTVATFKLINQHPADPSWKYVSFFVETTAVTTVSGSNAAYIVTKDIIAQVMAKRFNYSNTNNTAVFRDYGDFILGLVKLPFTVDPSYIQTDDSIKLGDKDTHITAPTLSTDKIAVDLGSIKVDAKFNNTLDFVDTIAVIHLPHAPSINIDLDYVIGQTLRVIYVIDVYTGKATILISSTKINDVVVMQETDLGINIPYINSATNHAENDNIQVGGDNGLKVPFIEILRGEAVLADGMFTIPIVDEDILKKHIGGYIQVERIDLRSQALKEEQEKIISLLNSGVIIREL